MARAMATTVSTSLLPAMSSGCRTRQQIVAGSVHVVPQSSVSRVRIGLSIPRPSFRHLCPWNGLKHLGISCRHRHRNKGGKERYMGRIYASLFGVGAPEALVIGVVALLVFGPKGLAEVARNLGQTLRAFQPTIRELQDVSRDFKSTLEREIGLDEVPRPMNNSAYQSTVFNPQAMLDPNGAPAAMDSTAESAQMPPSAAEPQGAPNLQPSEATNVTSQTASSGSAENSQAEGNKV
ncbi:bacterial sec-independent translocation protein mttA/Hcf106 [Wolffia australiana]